MTHPTSHSSSLLRSRVIRGLWSLGAMAVITLVVVLLKTPRRDDVPPETETVAVDQAPVPLPPPVSQKYVGSQACAKCHAEIMQKYAGHPMAQSLATVQAASPIENREQREFSPIKGLTYSVEHRADQVFHHEVRKDADGQVIYDQAVPVHYAVGSGTRGRTYLINDAGRLFESMISWYADGNVWNLSPGYRPELNERFERQCSDGCLSCHAGRMAPHGQDLDRFADSPFLETAIGCERCHGPAQDHIAFHEKGTRQSGETDPIVNPIDFTDSRRDAVCGQCHFQGRRRVVNFGRSEFDFRPGMYLSENWTVFVKTAGVKSGNAAAVSQVEQMHASQCYQKGNHKLSCIDCHDPHQVPAADQKVNFYRDKCLKCHSSGQTECSEKLDIRKAASAEDSCIQCHMPSFNAQDVHAAQTDHRVLRRPLTESPEPEDQEALRDTNLTSSFEEPGFTQTPEVKDRARGIYLSEWALAGQNLDLARQSIDLLIPWVKRVKNDVEALYSLGQAFGVAKQSEFAVRSWTLVLERQPTHEGALESLAIHFHQAKDLTQAWHYYERLLKVNPSRSNYPGRLAHILGQLGDFESGKAAANKALEINPSLVQAHAWLAEVAHREGNESLADKHAKIVEQFYSTQPPGRSGMSKP